MEKMKELWKVWQKDIQKDDFSKSEMLLFGVVAPLALVLVCVVMSWVGTLI